MCGVLILDGLVVEEIGALLDASVGRVVVVGLLPGFSNTLPFILLALVAGAGRRCTYTVCT